MAEFHENLITAEQAVTLDGLFARRVRRTPDRPAYRYYDKQRKAWFGYTWSEMAGQVGRWQQALGGLGLQPGDRAAVLLRNCPEWVMFDLAAMSLGLVTVPLYTDDRPDNVAYILRDSGARLLLVQDPLRWRHLAEVLPEERDLTVLLLEGDEAARDAAAADPQVHYVHDLLPSAAELKVRRDADTHALASIVYTSGTTGRSKGVMLSHHNMLSVAHGSLQRIEVYQEDILLSFLPLSHTLERTVGYYLAMMAGSEVAYARSVGQLAEDLQTVRPTALIAVPRIFDRVHGRIQDNLGKQSVFARKLLAVTVNVGWSRFLRQQGRGGWRLSHLLWPLLERLVASKVQARLGGRMRLAVSGGAPLSPDIARFFLGLGVPLVQGYGLTETSPVVSCNNLPDNIPASVGKVIPNTQVRIGDHDELLVHGPGVMLGYWNNHTATAQMINADGWLHTGDQARIDAQGNIYITGRIKDILVLSNGEKIPPGDMESAIALDPLVEQVMVVGEGRSFLSALAVLDGEKWPGFAQALGLDPLSPVSLHDDKLEKAVLRRIREALKDFPGYAKIRRVCLMLEPWTVDDGLVTPTMKVRRPKVLERYRDAVEALYSET